MPTDPKVKDFGAPWYKALPNDEGVDCVAIVLEPRYKTSGVSGDEWRTSARVILYRKGYKVGEEHYLNMRVAVDSLPGLFHRLPESTDVPLWGYNGQLCMQPGCPNTAVVGYRIREEFSRHGEGPLPQSAIVRLRAFCRDHARRGDASREDSDDNYELLSSGFEEGSDAD